MKRTLGIFVLALTLILALSACGQSTTPPQTASPSPAASEPAVPSSATPEELQEVTITDFDGNEVTLKQNPKRVAIFDYAILDILNSVGFEKTGIEQLVVPTKDTLPASLSYYKNLGDDKVLTGGTLFYVDWDVLDLVQPELVLLGGRTFGQSPAGDRLSEEDNAKYRAETEDRYAGTAFAKLSVNTKDSALMRDMENNVAALAAIFPQIAPELEAKLAEIKAAFADIAAKAQASEKTAMFVMMVDQTSVSVFLPSSRFDMLYEEFGFASVEKDAAQWTDQHGFDVRAEYILEANPDVIFILDRSATVGSGAGAENFMKDLIIGKSTASQNGDIYVLSGDAWYTMTGGFSAAEAMIADINQYIEKLN